MCPDIADIPHLAVPDNDRSPQPVHQQPHGDLRLCTTSGGASGPAPRGQVR